MQKMQKDIENNQMKINHILASTSIYFKNLKKYILRENQIGKRESNLSILPISTINKVDN